jgi:flavodoxin
MTKFKLGEKARVVKYIDFFSNECADSSIGDVITIKRVYEPSTFPYVCSDRVYRCDEELEKVEEWTLNNLPKKVKVVKKNDEWDVNEELETRIYNAKVIYFALLAGVLEPVEENSNFEELIEKFNNSINEWFNEWVIEFPQKNIEDKLLSKEDKNNLIEILEYHQKNSPNYNPLKEKAEKLLEKLK